MRPEAIIGRRVREGREQLGLSQQAFADRIGSSQQQVGLVELGATNMRLSTLLQFAEGIGTTASDLLRGV